jgi:hypothetical protein
MPLLLLALLLIAAGPARATERWRWPLRGDVLTPFHLAQSPFARGQHRGIDIAAEAGARVRSACPGRVRFAGPLPGRGSAVTVLCGALVATYLELATATVERGAMVAAGDKIGTVAASHLQLGARRAGERHGYIDPLTLLAAPPPPPLGAAPRPRRGPPTARGPARIPPPRARVAARERTPLADREKVPLADRARVPLADRERVPLDDRERLPLAAWLGLGLVAAGTPVGALWHRRRRRSRVHPAIALRSTHEGP